jgi:hypothetical protein
MNEQAVPSPEVALLLQNLQQRYAVLTDQGHTDPLAELFTDDAVWDGNELGYGYAEGPAAIAANVTGHFRADRPMMHLPGPLLLTAVADDEVHGTSWCMATRWLGDSTSPIIYFHYEDVFRRGADGTWRYGRRVLRRRFPA